MAPFLLTLLLVAIGWYFLIRPQQARIREQREVVATLEVDDRVITAGGIHGTLTAVSPETVTLRVADGVELVVARAAIVRRIDDAPIDDAALGEAGSADHEEIDVTEPDDGAAGADR